MPFANKQKQPEPEPDIKPTFRSKMYDSIDSVVGQPLADAQQYVADKLGVGDTLKYAAGRPEALGYKGDAWGEGDAARHLLLSGELHRTSPKLAPLLLYGHELLNFFQGSTIPSIQQDLDNNALGKQLAKGAKSREEVEQRVKAFLPNAATSIGKKVGMDNPLDLLKSGLQALDLNKMQTEGFDVNAHHERLLTTGPFADAQARQSVWEKADEAPKEEAPTTFNVDDAANELRQQTSGSTVTGIDENLGMAELHQARQRHSELTMGTVFGGATGNWGANQNSPILMQPKPRMPIQPVQE